MSNKKTSMLTKSMITDALVQALKKLNPKYMVKNPVMFVVEVAACLVTVISIIASFSTTHVDLFFDYQIVFWLWITLLFATFAESIAESKGKAQTNTLKTMRSVVKAKVVGKVSDINYKLMEASDLSKGCLVLVEIGDVIPGDGEIVSGIATIDESAITGESAPVVRESGGDRSAVTAGTLVVSDYIYIRITSNSGDSFLDRMIRLVEGATRKKTPNELALNILLSGFTLIFIVVATTILPFTYYAHASVSIIILVCLLVTLIPTTIAGLLSAIGIAGMDRLLQKNVIALSGRAVEAAGDIDTLLLDKTGTITHGNRCAKEIIPISDVSLKVLCEVAYLSSLTDETPEGRSVLELAKQQLGSSVCFVPKEQYIDVPFSSYTKMSGIDIQQRQIRKGSSDAIINLAKELGCGIPDSLNAVVEKIATQGGTPIVVSDSGKILGVIHLKDIIKKNIREKFMQLNMMGINTIMVTGDNPLTAAAIAYEAGVNDFVAQAKPETKMELIKKEKSKGKMVAMCGDGTNDAPALAQADVGVAMATGTMAAREASNMVDMDSDPTKIIDIIKVGKQLLMTRGALTTFSVANDLAKYFAIIPSMFVGIYPSLNALNIMHLHSPQSAILSALIFNAIIIVLLIPMALRGVKYKLQSATKTLNRNLMIFGVGGIITPFIGIKVIDIILTCLGMG